MDNKDRFATGVELDDKELENVSGGIAPRKARCPKCGQITLVIKFRKFKCTNPNCGFEQPM